MGQKKKPKSQQEVPAAQVGIFIGGELVEGLVEPVPDDFPAELVPYLSDFMARGINAAMVALRAKPQDWLRRARGRPIDAAVQQLGQEAAKLHKEGLTYGQIALRLCPRKTEPGHRCGKNCADRIRQAAKAYL
jgi:hypothetical protein